MSNVVRLPGDAHQQAQLLLPWYAAGTLDEADRARVAAHLEVCARCRADLDRERRIGLEFEALPLDVEQGWAAMSRRLEEHAGSRAAPALPVPSRRPAVLGAPAWLGWAAAAGLAGLLTLAVLAPKPESRAQYHTLSSPAPAVPGDVVVMFRPAATEAQIAAALRSSDARLADGPTAAGAYILRVPPARIDSALRDLRSQRAVAMAEPISQPPP
ncbi:MAG TPA: zf-HC2 domain-containing protein [Caulobacteraceae bacterium]|nr:zf-HC2 domain-containing protein [Caulobacteraceae bacterium]